MKNQSAIAVISCVVLLFTFSPTADSARRNTLQEPPQGTIPCAISLEATSEEIDRYLAENDWATEQLSESAIKALKIHNDKHRLEIIVHFGHGFYDIDYSDSFNLNYRVQNGVSQIHPAANQWMSSLNLTRAAISPSPLSHTHQQGEKK